MIKIARILIAVFMMIVCISSAYAEGYNVLVIPDSYLRNVNKKMVKSIDIEEMLARKFITKMEEDNMAYAPTISVLRISIKNNSKFDRHANESIDNIRILSKAYGVPKVLVIKTNTEMSSNNQQKMFWNRLDLPVLIPFEPSMKLSTTLTMYNIKDDEVIWSDVYYKKLAVRNNGVSLEDINKYYDELIPKVFNNIRDSKETHAIMVNNAPSDFAKVSEEKMNPIKQFIENLKNRYAIREIERQEKLLEEKVAEKKAKEEREAKREAKKSIKKVVNKPKPNLEVGLDKKVVKQEDTQKKRFLDPIQFKFYIVKQDLFKNIKKEFDNPEKKEINRQHRMAKKLLKEKQAQEKKEIVKTKQVKIKPKKEVKTAKKKSLKDSLKLKYQDFKIQNAKKQDEKTKIKTVEEPKKYQYLIESDNDGNFSVNKYIQSKPRYNSRNYIPRYDYNVNDI